MGLMARFGYGKYFNWRMCKVETLKRAIHEKANEVIAQKKSKIDLDDLDYGQDARKGAALTGQTSS